jgi:methionine synthase I (cobalamin-dependent)
MAEYKELRSRLEAREIILLDGAIGTQLQSMGVPMDNDA